MCLLCGLHYFMLIANRKGSSNNKYRISDIRKKKVPIPTVPSAHPLKINAPLLKAVWSRLWCDLEWKRKKKCWKLLNSLLRLWAQWMTITVGYCEPDICTLILVWLIIPSPASMKVYLKWLPMLVSVLFILLKKQNIWQKHKRILPNEHLV